MSYPVDIGFWRDILYFPLKFMHKKNIKGTFVSISD